MVAARVMPSDAVEGSLWLRLHGRESVREEAIFALHESLRREAFFHLRARTARIPDFPRSDLSDLAVQAADDALLSLLRKLDDFRGESQFTTWVKRFAQLEAAVSVRRRMGRERLVEDPSRLSAVADVCGSAYDRVESQERLAELCGLIAGELTARQRVVLVAVAIDGVPPATLASRLGTTPGAIYKSLHDARRRLTSCVTAGVDG